MAKFVLRTKLLLEYYYEITESHKTNGLYGVSSDYVVEYETMSDILAYLKISPSLYFLGSKNFSAISPLVSLQRALLTVFLISSSVLVLA